MHFASSRKGRLDNAVVILQVVVVQGGGGERLHPPVDGKEIYLGNAGRHTQMA